LVKISAKWWISRLYSEAHDPIAFVTVMLPFAAKPRLETR